MLKIKIKKHHPDMPDLQKHGDWIDLYFCGIHPKNPFPFGKHRINIYNNIHSFFKDDRFILSLGISVQLPKGYEALIVPRSSLFIKKGILLGNSMGIIDNDYCGNNDIWGFPAYFLRPAELKLFERIAQFRIIQNMPQAYCEYVEELSNKNRGGFGSSDNKIRKYKDGSVEMVLGWAGTNR